MTIATVTAITGQAWARDADGNLRELSIGDTLQEGEVLVTADGARVELDFGDNLDPTVIQGGEEVAMTPQLSGEEAVAEDEASALDEDLEALLTAIDEGEGDLLAELDPTAAGAGPGGGAEGGHSFVMLARITEPLTPLSYEYGLGQFDQVEFPEDTFLDQAEEDSIPTVTTLDLDGDGDTVWESALEQGSGGGVATTSGAFQIDTGSDVLALIEVQDAAGNWVAITASGADVQGTYGVLSVNPDGSWTYTLTQPLDHPLAGQTGASDQVPGEAFAVRVTDDDGDVSPEATLTIDVNDDGPVASDDGAAIVEDTTTPLTGDVLVNDTLGADRPEGVVFDAADVSGAQYGTFTDNGDGTWSYALDNTHAAVQGLSAGETLTETFDYTLTDADGDTSTATLTVTINGQDDGVVLTGLDVAGAEQVVNEANLADGSSPDAAALTQSGTFSFTALDELGSLSVGGQSLGLADLQGLTGTPVTLTSAHGTLTLTGFSGTAAGGTLSYTYTLDSTVDNDTVGGATDADYLDSFAVNLVDSDGSSANASLDIQILDDVPSVSANDTVLLDDDALTGGNPGGIGDVDPDTANTTGTLGHSVGADGGSLAWLTAGAPSGFTYEASGDDLLIKQDGTTVITLTLDTATGAYTVIQNAAIDHALGDDENDQAFTVGYRVTDGDGDTADGSLTINVNDDTPVDFTTSSADLVDGYTAALNFASAAGADGVGDVTFAQSLDGEPAVDSTGQSLYLDGEPLFYTVSPDGHLLTAATTGGETGFTVTLDPGSDSYTVAVEGLVLNGSLFSANPVGGVSGGNSLLYLINSEDGIDGNDVLVSSTSTDTVNTSTGGGIGIGTGQDIELGELARFDFLSGLALAGNDATWDERLSVFGVEQSMNVSGNPQSAATLEIFAVATAGAMSGEHPSNGSDTYLNLSVDDIRIYDADGGDVTSSVTLTDMGDGIRVEGVKNGWSYEVTTDSAFQAIEVVGGNGASFKLGGMDFLTGGTAGSFDINLDIVAEDADGDSIEGSITLASPEPAVLEVGGNIENSLSGNAGDDVLIGDTGGNYTVITPGESYNISLIVDSSGSMRDPSGTAGKSRMELAQDALKQLAAQLVNHDGVINLQIIDFDTGAISTVFTNISSDDLADIETAINTMAAEGGTNYEAGFKASTDWFNGQTNGYVNKALFLTDGDPTYYEGGGNGSSTTEEVMRESIEAFGVLTNAGDDGTRVEAIGIGNGVSEDRLQFFDNTDVTGYEEYWQVNGPDPVAPAGEITIVNTADELNAALQGGSSADELAPVGDDILSGGEGDDILFGDTIAPVGQPGAGLAGVIALVKDANDDGGEPTDQQIIDYLRANPDSYETPEGQGGDDTLNGGAGNDILYGGEGADTFVWNFGDQGTVADPAEDTVMDFTLGSFGVDADADKLDISDLLQGASDSTIDAYVFAEEDGNGNTLLHISSSGQLGSNGADADQTIVLNDVGMGSQSSADFLQSLIGNDQLDIE